MVTAINRQLIDGQWQDGSSGSVLTDRNPYDGSVIAEFPVATPDDIDAAYRAAGRAKEEWDRINPYAKRTVFENAVKYVESNFGEITEIIRSVDLQDVGARFLIVSRDFHQPHNPSHAYPRSEIRHETTASAPAPPISRQSH